MLIATPYRDFEVRDKHPPKIISEVRKTYLNSPGTGLRLTLSGEVLVKTATDNTWYPRRVQVKNGQLNVFSLPGASGPSSIRLPLRHLSLQVGPLPHSIAICKGSNTVLMLQTPNEKAFGKWVKTLAIELIRQTPLDAIKYLDILTLAEYWKRRDINKEDWTVNKEKEDQISNKNFNIQLPRVPDWNNQELDQNQQYEKDINRNFVETKNKNVVIVDKETTNPNAEKVIESLLKKCQNVEVYVPVKEKLFLFESLCKMGRKVKSSEDVSTKPQMPISKRTKSCHDLSDRPVAVRDICKYFEERLQCDEEHTLEHKVPYSNNLKVSWTINDKSQKLS
ncbi:uncharacterized protein LOC126735777 [Anthonomus grandis grandis]|uniref:uncharacterized protein LOC126735777 n=1 Tax=Anthonomus grandis grandis TaxID=2921223 RepID=UPI0021650D25|nr:uncharacterized protein LOC126735777 [Anthonomus grandis grandis]